MIKQIFIVSIFLFLSTASFAEEPFDRTIEVNTVAEILRQKMARSWTEYEARASHCWQVEKQTKAPVLNPKKLEELQFEKKELLFALKYLSIINFDECMAREQGEFVVDYARFQYFLKQNKLDIPMEDFKLAAGDEFEEISDNQDIFDAIDSILFDFGGDPMHYAPEVAYLNLTTQQKQYLEQVVGKKMFQVTDALRALYPEK